MNPLPLRKTFGSKDCRNKFNNLPRKNKQIRAREVRLIGHDGKQIGIVPLNEALNLAQEFGLDLVEISPKAQPPVCKILDFGKYMYEEGKKDKAKKTTTAKLKEIKLGPVLIPMIFRQNCVKRNNFFLTEIKLKSTLI